jgi:hypothetical protein
MSSTCCPSCFARPRPPPEDAARRRRLTTPPRRTAGADGAACVGATHSTHCGHFERPGVRPPSAGRRMSISKYIRSLLSGRAGRPAPETQAPRTARHHWITNPWHAVSIVPGKPVCHKARALLGVRFLSPQAPSLPLQGCEMSCSCRYRHHQDRRREARRAADLAASGAYWRGAERRRSSGRRSTDTA